MEKERNSRCAKIAAKMASVLDKGDWKRRAAIACRRTRCITKIKTLQDYDGGLRAIDYLHEIRTDLSDRRRNATQLLDIMKANLIDWEDQHGADVNSEIIRLVRLIKDFSGQTDTVLAIGGGKKVQSIGKDEPSEHFSASRWDRDPVEKYLYQQIAEHGESEAPDDRAITGFLSDMLDMLAVLKNA